ncbi:hypothetical protein GAYE_SCF39G5293 [Galdieria yellowstonensis]|uniref:Uncharacterized protein n=1 Tax=Galdieria yellowstonensis TaxID=3028027 RepID=A0AAV9IJJ5_9RHOD|nr:hypothetical protein GAYE_SCF39G5293 [Galdieria yellowstonensis]
MSWWIPAFIDNLGFPLYFCEKLSEAENYFCIGGGGGAAQTGVPNYVKVICWTGSRLMTIDEKKLDDVPTSACVFKRSLCVVVGPDICFFTVTQEQNTLVWQTKFRPDSNVQVRQTVVSCSEAANLLAVGNDEGRIRIYALDSTWAKDCRPPQTVLLHQKSIAEMDFSQDGALLVSVSLDRNCCIWDSRTGTKLMTLDNPPVRRYGIKAHFRCCQFSRVSAVEPKILYTVDVSLDSGTFISGWRVDKWQSVFSRKVSQDPVTFLSSCVIDGREYIAVGTNEGDVMIWGHDPEQKKFLLEEASVTRETGSHLAITRQDDNHSSGQGGWLFPLCTTQVPRFSPFRLSKKYPLHFLPVTGLSWSAPSEKNNSSSPWLLVTCADGYIRMMPIALHPDNEDTSTNIFWLLFPWWWIILFAILYSIFS